MKKIRIKMDSLWTIKNEMVLFIFYILLAQIFSDIHCFVQPTNSCSIAIQQFLSDSYPEFDGIRKSLSLEVGKYLFEG